MSKNKFIYLVILTSAMLTCQNPSSDYVRNRGIEVDSIMIVKNKYFKNKETILSPALHGFLTSEFIALVISLKIKNTTHDTLYIYTTPKIRTIFNNIIVAHIDSNEIHTEQYGTELIDTETDTLSPGMKKNYYVTYYGDIFMKKKHDFYSYVSIPVFDNSPDTSTLRNTEYKLYPYRYNENLENLNKFLIYVNLLENTARLVDSTFEEVLESYKRRGYIVK